MPEFVSPRKFCELIGGKLRPIVANDFLRYSVPCELGFEVLDYSGACSARQLHNLEEL